MAKGKGRGRRGRARRLKRELEPPPGERQVARTGHRQAEAPQSARIPDRGRGKHSVWAKAKRRPAASLTPQADAQEEGDRVKRNLPAGATGVVGPGQVVAQGREVDEAQPVVSHDHRPPATTRTRLPGHAVARS